MYINNLKSHDLEKEKGMWRGGVGCRKGKGEMIYLHFNSKIENNLNNTHRLTCRLMSIYNYSHLIFDKDGKITVEKTQHHQKIVQGKLDDPL